MLRYVRGLIGDDAWSQIARDPHTFRGDLDGFRAWAASVGRHRAVDHVRRRQRRPQTVLPVEQLHGLAGRADTARGADRRGLPDARGHADPTETDKAKKPKEPKRSKEPHASPPPGQATPPPGQATPPAG